MRSEPITVWASEPGSSATVPSWPTREQASGSMSGSSASGSFSACAARDSPQTVRAYSRSACWKPPQVPRNGMPSSRAVRIADRTPASLR
ncbi:hypothetical protein ASE41_13080 [Streptomyces sp. Root264]|nr:hypothetical protein ASE41_13080 [Streptomyces sp. Root264]